MTQRLALEQLAVARVFGRARGLKPGGGARRAPHVDVARVFGRARGLKQLLVRMGALQSRSRACSARPRVETPRPGRSSAGKAGRARLRARAWIETAWRGHQRTRAAVARVFGRARGLKLVEYAAAAVSQCRARLRARAWIETCI